VTARGAQWALVGLVLATVDARPALAHGFAFTDVTLALRANGTFAVDIACDVDALALGVDNPTHSAALAGQIRSMPPAEQDALVARLAEMLGRRVRVRFDGEPAPFSVSLPERGRPQASDASPSALGFVARLEGKVPAGAKTATFFASRAFPPVRLTVVSPDGRKGPVEALERGGESRPLDVARATAPEPPAATAARFLRLGFGHILPEGLDHILFVLGLALLSGRLPTLLAQVTAFTLAHTVTLALAVYGVVSLPSRVVEPLIAASIVYVAVENLFRQRASWTRLALVFCFGLLHGLGFAGALSDLGWPSGRRLLALLSFNAGVELGQLTVIGLALAALWASSRLGVPRRPVERALSMAIAAVGLVWTVQRLS